jgi:hypothetical protein
MRFDYFIKIETVNRFITWGGSKKDKKINILVETNFLQKILLEYRFDTLVLKTYFHYANPLKFTEITYCNFEKNHYLEMTQEEMKRNNILFSDEKILQRIKKEVTKFAF